MVASDKSTVKGHFAEMVMVDCFGRPPEALELISTPCYQSVLPACPVAQYSSLSPPMAPTVTDLTVGGPAPHQMDWNDTKHDGADESSVSRVEIGLSTSDVS